ncbi:MAG: 2-amino-4-hydroxy-6-hydroxymethyldihydropteridine diphosphokinase [Tepidisphaeraceae bacterium]
MRTSHPITAHIALGSNLGNRDAHLRGALSKLRETEGVRVVRVSSFFENPAVGMSEGSPPFLNAAAELETTLGSHALLHRLLAIEKELGRERRKKWEPRPIDLDLLLYGDHILSSDELVVPHPLMHERRFVLQPLAEIAPDAIHPTLQMGVKGLLENLK